MPLRRELAAWCPLFHSPHRPATILRYNGGNQARIWQNDAASSNMCSGFIAGWSGSTYHNGWMTSASDYFGTNWVISLDMVRLRLLSCDGSRAGTARAQCSARPLAGRPLADQWP